MAAEEGDIIYNVTTQVSGAVAADWLRWMREEHIPDLVATGCFVSATILRLVEVDETDGPTYAVQYRALSKSLYNRYIEKFSVEMRNKAFEKWGDRFISFRSVLQVVN